jgi:hypothetical protein
MPRRRTFAPASCLRSLDADCASASCLRWSATPALEAWAAPHRSRDRRRWRRRGGCPTCCACHAAPGGKSESPSDGSFAVPAPRRHAKPPAFPLLALRAWMTEGLDRGSRDRRRWRRRGGCPTCCAHHSVPGGKSESPSDGTFAVPAMRRRLTRIRALRLCYGASSCVTIACSSRSSPWPVTALTAITSRPICTASASRIASASGSSALLTTTISGRLPSRSS